MDTRALFHFCGVSYENYERQSNIFWIKLIIVTPLISIVPLRTFAQKIIVLIKI